MSPDPFRELLLTLPDEIAAAREAGLPVELEVDQPLPAHAQRLMDTLGVEVRVVTTLAHETISCPVRLCSWTWVGDPAKGQPYLDAHLKLMHASLGNTRRQPEGLDLLEQMDRGERIARPAPTEGEPMPELVCKIDGCDGDASDAPKAGPTSRLCPTHRAERSAQMSAARIGRPRSTHRTGGGNASKKKRSRTVKPRTRTVRTTAKAVPRSVAANGSHASKAERLLAAARAVDEIEAQLAQARAELKDAAAALAGTDV